MKTLEGLLWGIVIGICVGYLIRVGFSIYPVLLICLAITIIGVKLISSKQ